LYYLSKVLSAKGVQVTHILGFQSAKDVFLEQAFTELGPTFITTMDGTRGHQGLVTDVLDDWPYTQWQAMYACGPTPMLKALNDRFIGQEAYLSLEERMGCGIGACFACVCHTPDSATDYRKVCADGPVFKIGEVSL
jgi:dihydroorotate dehydrogenase electron transfer subunit